MQISIIILPAYVCAFILISRDKDIKLQTIRLVPKVGPRPNLWISVTNTDTHILEMEVEMEMGIGKRMGIGMGMGMGMEIGTGMEMG